MEGEPATVQGPSVVLAVVDHVATVVLGQPPMSQLALRSLRDLDAVCDELSDRHDVRAVVIAGSDDRSFAGDASGGDLGGRSASIEDTEVRLELERRAFEKVAALPQPTVAAIRGYALGGGLELALSCDFRVAGRSAGLGFPEVRVGVLPASSGLARLPLIVGDSRAKRLAMLGEVVAADEARAMGLVDEVVGDDDVIGRSVELAARLADRPPAAVRAVKRVLEAQRELSHVEALRLIVETALSSSATDGTAAVGRKEGRGETNVSRRS